MAGATRCFWKGRVMTAESQERLEAEGDALLVRMQVPTARQAVRRAFAATPREMGQAAVAQAQRGR